MLRVLFFLLCIAVCQAREELSLEEKVGQLLMVCFHGEEVNENARVLVQDIQIGGIIYYRWANGLTSIEQVRTLSRNLQRLSEKVPLLIGIDQEGGIVSRLQEGFTLFPGNGPLGYIGDPELAREAAEAMGEELRGVGVNLNFAPVVDLNSNPQNPVIGIRSFSDDPGVVCALGKKVLEGYHRSGIAATLKHFPGHGDVILDSHQELPVVGKSLEELEKRELLPFSQLAASADAIMTAHLLVPALDEKNCSTLSKKTLSYLKEKIGFKGVIVSDSLVMEGVLKTCHTVEEAAIQALEAGCDLLLLGGRQLLEGNRQIELSPSEIKAIHHSIVEAVKKGRISEARIDEAVGKILELKKKYSLVEEALPECLAAHEAIAQKIATLGMQVFVRRPLKALNKKQVGIVAPGILLEKIKNTSLFNLGKSSELFLFKELNPSLSEIKAVEKWAEKQDVILFCSYNAEKKPSQKKLIEALSRKGKALVLLAVRDPFSPESFEQADLIINTFSPVEPSIEAVGNYLDRVGREEELKGVNFS